MTVACWTVGLTKFKRGQRVRVAFEGIVISQKNNDCVKVTVRPRPGKWSWWAIVPACAVEEIADDS